jgi:2-O-(6-phospho-alpha-D-mannosyl)-D-glycerate hydrolase
MSRRVCVAGSVETAQLFESMAPRPDQPLTVHVVSHTHWDREWYHPVGRFRQRLVALIDALLDDHEDAAPFLLDGQAIVLEDYLAIRPERRDELAARLRSGSLEAGPWYVLADELIPSGESLVRNLLAGRAVLESLGATAPQLLYSPDAFGHPAMLPALACGFGMPVIILWRGYGGAAHPRGDVARWCAPDGSCVLLYHLSPDGYELGASLPVQAEEALARWASLRAVLEPRATLGEVLLPNGADHHARQPDRARAVRALGDTAAPDRVRLSSLAEFGRALVSAAALADASAASHPAPFPTVRGELRDSYGYTWALQGTFGTRSALKRRAARAERSLLRNTEPWVALAERARRTERAALMHAAWKTLLACQPHDTLCGCSVDGVAHAMSARLDDVEVQSAGLREDALFDLIGYDAVATRAAAGAWRSAVVVCNPAVRARGGVAAVDVQVVRDHVRVGPGSAGATEMPIGTPSPGWTLDGGAIAVQALANTRRHERLESPLHYPWDDLVESTAALIWVPAIAGYGTRAFSLAEGEPQATAAPPREVRARGRAIENEFMRVDVDQRGVVALTTLDGTHAIDSLLSIEATEDAGDLYTPSLRGEPSFAELSGPRPGLRGPLRATLVIPWRVEPHPDIRLQRPESAAGTLTITLDAGARHLGIEVNGVNEMRNHRVRLHIATNVRNAEAFADAAFGPVRREPIVAPPGSAEIPPPTAPLARYVSLASAHRGATIYSDGLGEYEALSDGTVAVTLLRAVGELSRNDLPERPGHAGWPAPTPEAQEQGPFAGCFALLPHGPRDDATITLIEHTADDVLHPLAGRTVRSATPLRVVTEGVTLEGDGLALSTIKSSEDGAWLVLRCVNLTEREIGGAWILGAPVREARHSRLDEQPAELLRIQDNRVPFAAAPRAIVTLLVR